ncbi:MAG: peptide chain release factor N(5)-glutamine methyltransferase [Lachnospiraceae bacterium]|nr:peptide chain release factor N(5)-glutamine methyltransferase [Lachnospiraceae bacterium]
MNYSSAYKTGTDRLSAAGIPEAALDSRLLLEFITGCGLTDVLAHPERELTDDEAAAYERALSRRAEHVPLSYITHTCGFMGIVFRVSADVLIPRQDSECLVEEAMRYTYDGSDILDLCTGSGCLLLSLMHYKNGCRGVGVDISEEALCLARENQRLLDEDGGLNGGSAKFICGDMFDAVPSGMRFDVIISNPPYIRTGDIEGLMPEVALHEPRIALDGGPDGLMFYRKIAARSGEYLAPGGYIFLEIGYDQAGDVRMLLRDAGFSDIEVIKDYSGNDRVIKAEARRRA